MPNSNSCGTSLNVLNQTFGILNETLSNTEDKVYFRMKEFMSSKAEILRFRKRGEESNNFIMNLFKKSRAAAANMSVFIITEMIRNKHEGSTTTEKA